MPPSDAGEPATVPKLWGVVSGMRVWVGGHNTDAKRKVEKHLTSTVRPAIGPIDLGFIVPRSVDEAVYFAGKLLSQLVPGGAIWVIHSQTIRKRETKLTLAPEALTEALDQIGFLESGSVSVSDELLSHRFKPRGE